MGIFNEVSKRRIALAHEDLQKVLYKAREITLIPFEVSETLRSIALQQQYYREGKSHIDGVIKIGKHNMTPAMAADVFIQDGRKMYDLETLSYLAGVITTVAEFLFELGQITHKVRWGGNWDMDGEILTDQTLDDRPHVELYKPK